MSTTEIAAAILGKDLEDQAAIDAALIALDGTPNKGRLGANAVLGASLAVAHVAAACAGRGAVPPSESPLARGRLGENVEPTLPLPMVNMISGGLHAGANLDFQDFLMIAAGASTYAEALEMTAALYRAVGGILRTKDFEANLVGDEGGYGPKLRTNAQAVDHILEAVLACGLEIGRDVAIAIDVAASHLYEPEAGIYHLSATGDGTLDIRRHDRDARTLGPAVPDRLDRGRPGRGRLGRLGRP